VALIAYETGWRPGPVWTMLKEINVGPCRECMPGQGIGRSTRSLGTVLTEVSGLNFVFTYVTNPHK
jgi:hypothetical protein